MISRIEQKEKVLKVLEVIEIMAKAMPLKSSYRSIEELGFISHVLWNNIWAVHPVTREFVVLTEENKILFIDLYMQEWTARLQNVYSCFNIVNKPYLITVFEHTNHLFSTEEYNELLHYVWTVTEFPHQTSIPVLVKLFKKSNPELLMEKEDRGVYDLLPQEFTVYRGTQGKNAKRRGLSWTLSKDKAEWFKKRFTGDGKVYSATINKRDVFAYFDDRSEQEVVLNPYKLKNIKEAE